MAYKVPRVQRVMLEPINLIFRFLQSRARVSIWLEDNDSMRIDGHIVGFDEYLNMVLDDAEEHYVDTGERRKIGRIMLKGSNVTLIQYMQP